MNSSSPSDTEVFLTGAHGMLARDLRRCFTAAGVAYVCTDRAGSQSDPELQSLDITQADAVLQALNSVGPKWVVNCAAYTAVDRAEAEPDLAQAVNGTGVQNLARACKAVGSKLLHVSTDYVFGGADGRAARREPYAEEDPPAPCGVYGRTKYAGEVAAQDVLGLDALVVRTSWLHGIAGPNFLKTMLQLAEKQNSLRVVADQTGTPTYTGWLADVILRLLRKDIGGTLHVAMRGETSWCDYAREIFRIAQKNVEVLSVTTEEFPRPAPRPRYSALDCSRLQKELGVGSHAAWQDGVRWHLRELMGVVN